MKTVMKKLLSFMLVAVLLIGVFPATAFAASEYSVQVIVYNYATDEALSQWTESWTVTEAEANQSTGFFGADWAEELLDGTDYADTSKYTPKSVVAQVEGNVLVYRVYVNVLSTNTGSNDGKEDTKVEETPSTGNGSGEAQPDVTVSDVSLTIVYNLAGYVDNTVKATAYSLYKEYVGEPARGGYDFLGWYSSYYGRIIDITKDVVAGNDTITAKWSSAKSFNLTLDENRGEEETVNYGVRVTYGENIYDKVSKYNPTRKGYVFMGWKLNGKIIDKNTVWDLPDDATAYAVWKLESDTEGEAMNGSTNTADGKVYLEIYLNGKTSELAKRVNITSYASDNKITRAEAKEVVAKYFSAKSGYTLKYEGLFDEETWWWYTRDPETDGEDSIIVNRDGDDYVYIMVNNVKVEEADSTNPKTGDMIFVPMIFMVATAAAAVLVLNGKKRIVK